MRGGWPGWAAITAALAALLAGCGSGGGAPSGGGQGGGPVSVLYAGSLVDLMEHDLGPAFDRAGPYRFQGYGGGSTQVAMQVKSGVRRGDVFVSASPKADAVLQGPAGGGFVSWYATFAQAPLVLGYDPHSAFARQLRTRPWYEVIAQPGIRVGRTDPKLDPKGKLTVMAVQDAARRLGRPGLPRALAAASVFPEEDLVGRLQAGQLDAGFFYTSEAVEQRIPTVSLAPVAEHATYTVTVLRGAPNAAGAQAFVRHLLGPSGRGALRRHGLTVLRPTLTGSPAAVPPGLRAVVGGR